MMDGRRWLSPLFSALCQENVVTATFWTVGKTSKDTLVGLGKLILFLHSQRLPYSPRGRSPLGFPEHSVLHRGSPCGPARYG